MGGLARTALLVALLQCRDHVSRATLAIAFKLRQKSVVVARPPRAIFDVVEQPQFVRLVVLGALLAVNSERHRAIDLHTRTHEHGTASSPAHPPPRGYRDVPMKCTHGLLVVRLGILVIYQAVRNVVALIFVTILLVVLVGRRPRPVTLVRASTVGPWPRDACAAPRCRLRWSTPRTRQR